MERVSEISVIGKTCWKLRSTPVHACNTYRIPDLGDITRCERPFGTEEEGLESLVGVFWVLELHSKIIE